MRTAQTSLEKARRDAKTWHKLLAIHQDGDDTVVTVVRGLCLGHEPSVLADELRFVSSPELTAFLATPEIQQKLFRPSQRGIVLVDVAGYSKFDTRGQSGILTILYEGLQLAKFSSELFSRGPSIDQIIPTGDGCFIIFKPASSDRLLQSVFSIQSSFYCHQKGLLRMRGKQHLNVLGIRLACHVGDVDFIIDSAGSRNAYGTGLNEAARILQYGPPALEKQLGGEAPTGVAFFSKALDSQARPIIDFFDRRPSRAGQVKFIDLGRVRGKHDLELELRCFTNIPNHFGFPFDTAA
jgi:hypothetical protein